VEVVQHLCRLVEEPFRLGVQFFQDVLHPPLRKFDAAFATLVASRTCKRSEARGEKRPCVDVCGGTTLNTTPPRT
jgi:hypothetical protein